jgi:hypothetical protein
VEEIPIRTAKITSNDSQEMLYLPQLLRKFGFKKGVMVLLKIDSKGRLVVEKIPELTTLEPKGERP